MLQYFSDEAILLLFKRFSVFYLSRGNYPGIATPFSPPTLNTLGTRSTTAGSAGNTA
jgi:hypothetical protein